MSRKTRSTTRWRPEGRRAAGGRGDVEARGEKPFRDITDFASRINPRAINKRVLESLAASGAFDALEGNRARAYAGVDAILATRSASTRRRRSARTTCSAGRRCARRFRYPRRAVAAG
jgi:DNA polymerase-3 subunit alpha